MITEHILVTGALGCISAWVVRHLVAAGVPVTVFLAVTPLDAGVAETVAAFRRALDKGLIAL